MTAFVPARAALATVAAVLALAVLAVAAPAAGAETIVVSTTADTTGGSCTPTSGTCSLREAVQLVEAEEPSEPVKIEITATGTIDVGAKGEIELDIPEETEALEIVGPGSGQLTISGGGESRVFRLSSETDFFFSNLTIADGSVTGAAIDGDGGAGILIEEAEGAVTLEGVRLTENRVASDRSGGAIALEEGTLSSTAPLEIIDSRIDHNFSEEGGGGIYADSEDSVLVWGTELDHNEAEEGSGGAILLEKGPLEVDGSTLTENRAAEFGGAIRAEDAATIERSTFIANSVPDVEAEVSGGGAIAQTAAEPLLVRDSTVTGNSGGAIYGVGVEIAIRNSTIVANSSDVSPGAGIEAEQFVIQSTILQGNERDSSAADCDGTAFSQGNNLVGSTVGCNWVAAGGDLFGLDPDLGPLGDYGGQTPTLPPVSRESPVINAGENPQATDQRQRTRPVPNTAADTDIGAVEVQAPVLEVADPPAISPDTDLKSGEELVCEPGTWDTDTVTDSSFTYAWSLDGEPAGSGATYALSNEDAGKPLRCEVSVDNGVLATSAESAPVQMQAALAVVAPTEFDFGSRRVGTGPSEPETLVVENVGGAGLEVTGALTTNDEFPIDASACDGAVLAAEATCEIEASFDPGAPGQQGSFVIVETSAGNPVASLSGKATDFSFSANPGSVDFGEQLLGTTSGAETVVVSNLGDAPMDLAAVAVAGINAGDFAIDSDGCGGTTVEPGGECSVNVTFSPSAVGGRVATLAFSGDLNANVPLAGTGVAPALTIAPAPLDYGSHLVGTKSGAQTFTVTNVGSAPAEVDSVALGGADPDQFELGGADTCTDAALDPGEECTVSASFAPTVVGEAEAALEVSSDAPTAVSVLTGTAFGLPEFSASPTQLDFGPVRVDTGPSPAETVTVTNDGTAAMEIETVTIEGADGSAFAIVPGGDFCAGTILDPAEECEVEVTFDPAEARGYGATLAFAGDDPGTVGLFGTGIAPQLLIEPSPLDYGSHLVGTKSGTQTFTVTNVGAATATLGTVTLGGDDPGQFELGATDTCSGASLDPDEECTVQVTFAPTVVGEAEAVLQVPSDAPTATSVLTGIAFGQPEFAADPTQVDFGPVGIEGGPSSPETVTVTNEGTATMEIDSVTIEGSGAAVFAIVSGGNTCTGATLDPAEECEVEVTFDPAATVGYSATLAFAGDDPGTVGLFGTGIAPELTVAPNPLDYGSHLVGFKSGVQTFIVKNVGGDTATLGTVTLGGEDPGQFELGSTAACDGAVLDPDEECAVDVSFAPTEPGLSTALLQVSGDAPASATLSGTGTKPAFSAAPSSFDFGTLAVEDAPSDPEPIVVTNSGTGPMEIGPIFLAGTDPGMFSFEADGCSNQTLAAAASCEIDARFVPTGAGDFSANLVFPGTAAGTVKLEGTGIAPKFSATPVSLDFGSRQIGSGPGPAQSVTVGNEGSAPLVLGGATLSGVSPTSFAVLAGGDNCSGKTLAPSQACTVQVVFAPLTPGDLAAELNFPGNVAGGVILHGFGSQPPPPPPPEPPKPEQIPALALAPHKGPLRVAANGAAKFALVCDSPSGAACQGTVTIQAAKKTVRWKGKVEAGASRLVSVKFAKPVRKELASKGKVKGQIVVSSAAGKKRTKVTLKPI